MQFVCNRCHDPCAVDAVGSKISPCCCPFNEENTAVWNPVEDSQSIVVEYSQLCLECKRKMAPELLTDDERLALQAEFVG